MMECLRQSQASAHNSQGNVVEWDTLARRSGSAGLMFNTVAEPFSLMQDRIIAAP